MNQDGSGKLWQAIDAGFVAVLDLALPMTRRNGARWRCSKGTAPMSHATFADSRAA
jgi:hypothetical protein